MSTTVSSVEVLEHVCQILEMEQSVAGFLQIHQISSVRRLTTTTVDCLEELAAIETSPLSKTNINQINLLLTWYANLVKKAGRVMNDVLVQELTEDAWDKFCHEYLVFVINQQRQQETSTTAPMSPSPGKTMSPSVPQAQVPVGGLQVSLKDYLLTTGKASDWPRY